MWFCCLPMSAQSTMLSVDKTNSLSDMHVTAICFKNPAVVRRETQDDLLCCRPVPTWSIRHRDFCVCVFFHQLVRLLVNKPSAPILGEWWWAICSMPSNGKSSPFLCPSFLHKASQTQFEHLSRWHGGTVTQKPQHNLRSLFCSSGLLVSESDTARNW